LNPWERKSSTDIQKISPISFQVFTQDTAGCIKGLKAGYPQVGKIRSDKNIPYLFSGFYTGYRRLHKGAESRVSGCSKNQDRQKIFPISFQVFSQDTQVA
jgi:hypothetical protein